MCLGSVGLHQCSQAVRYSMSEFMEKQLELRTHHPHHTYFRGYFLGCL